MELTYHVELLKNLVTYIQKAYMFQALIFRFPLTYSYCKKVSLCAYIFLRVHVLSFVWYIKSETTERYEELNKNERKHFFSKTVIVSYLFAVHVYDRKMFKTFFNKLTKLMIQSFKLTFLYKNMIKLGWEILLCIKNNKGSIFFVCH